MINTANISVENAPPIHIPFRFILTAPLFGLFFSLLLLFSGPELISNRWNPEMIGALHLVNIGLLMMIVIGVLFQILPVIGGVLFPWQGIMARLIHLSLTVGVLLYFVGFFFSETRLLFFSSIALTIGLLPYILLLLHALFGGDKPAETIYLFRYPTLFLLLLTGSGVVLLTAPGIGRGVQFPLTDIHAVWALGGWFTLTLMGVSFQMIPMFQVTPDFPDWIKRMVIPFIATMLLLWGGGKMSGISVAGMNLDYLLVLAAVAMAVYGLSGVLLIARRKRKVFDVTVYFWQFSLLSLIAGSSILIFSLLFSGQLPGWLALFWIFSVLLPMMSGMLMKIAPFLVFLHLQQKVIKDPQQMKNLANIPNIFQILPTQRSRIMLIIFSLSMIAWGGALLFPAATHILGLILTIFFGWMFWIISSCYKTYWTKLIEFNLV